MPGNYKTPYRRYKRKLRWKANMRKHGRIAGDMPLDPFHVEGRTCPICRSGINTVQGKGRRPNSNFCEKGHRFTDEEMAQLWAEDMPNVPTVEHPQGLE